MPRTFFSVALALSLRDLQHVFIEDRDVAAKKKKKAPLSPSAVTLPLERTGNDGPRHTCFLGAYLVTFVRCQSQNGEQI